MSGLLKCIATLRTHRCAEGYSTSDSTKVSMIALWLGFHVTPSSSDRNRAETEIPA